MKNLKLYLIIILCINSLLSSAQYVMINQNRGVEYVVNGKYYTVKIHKTILHKATVIRTEGEFYVQDITDHSIKRCYPSPKGETLGRLMKRNGERAENNDKTSVDKGEKEKVPSINEIVINDVNRISPISFNYLIVDVRSFHDSYWNSFPVSCNYVESLAKAIEVKMIPYNHFNLKGHHLIVDPSQTTKSVILDKMRILTDDIKPYNNEMVLLYLSSHGVKDKEDNFHFITSDTRYDSIYAKVEGSVDAETITKCVSNLTSKGAKVLLFVDACYAGALIKDIGKVDGSCVYFVSTDNNKIAKEDSDQGSPFVRALTKSISGEEQLFFRSVDNVVNPDNLNGYLAYSVQKEFSEQKPTYYPLKIDSNYKLWSIKPSVVEKYDSLLRASDLGNTNAMVELGRIYYDDKIALEFDVTTDYVKALDYFERAYYLGNSKAACYLGIYNYYSPIPDYNKAFKFFEESSDKGCDLGTYYLSACYYKGHGVKANKVTSREILKRLTSVDSEIRNAHLKEKVFPEMSFENIVDVKLTLALSPMHIGRANLDRILDSDETELSFIKEYSASRAPRNRAKVGFTYLYGTEKRKKDYSKAYMAFESAASRKYGLGYYGLGLIFEGGAGVEKDYQKAEDYYRKAVDKGCSEAYVSWGNLYHIGGYGINKDEREAVMLWKKAADKGNVNGMYKYGVCLLEGCFVKKDEVLAFSYFLKCAKKMHSDSQYLVGRALFYGQGTKMDKVEAFKWLIKAKENGSNNAKALIDKVYYADGTPIE